MEVVMEVVSLQKSKSMVQALLGHNQVVFEGRWSHFIASTHSRCHL